MTVKDSCKIKAVSPSSIAHGDSFMVTYKGDLTSIRFRHLSGGIAGFLAPDRTDVGTTFGPGAWVWPFIFGETQIGIDSVAYFTNQNADGTRVFEPGSYYVKCFGPGGSVGNPILVTLTP